MPESAHAAAADRPAGPAPTTRTSTTVKSDHVWDVVRAAPAVERNHGATSLLFAAGARSGPILLANRPVDWDRPHGGGVERARRRAVGGAWRYRGQRAAKPPRAGARSFPHRAAWRALLTARAGTVD